MAGYSPAVRTEFSNREKENEHYSKRNFYLNLTVLAPHILTPYCECRWEHGIEIYYKEICCSDVYWIHQAQDVIQLWTGSITGKGFLE
jgi:hypothetical protein